MEYLESQVGSKKFLQHFCSDVSFLYNYQFFFIDCFVSSKYQVISQSLKFGRVENADFSDIADFISPAFINSCFRYSPIVNIENLDLKNPRLSNIRVFDIHL